MVDRHRALAMFLLIKDLLQASLVLVQQLVVSHEDGEDLFGQWLRILPDLLCKAVILSFDEMSQRFGVALLKAADHLAEVAFEHFVGDFEPLMLTEVATVSLGPISRLVNHKVVQVKHEVLLGGSLLLDADISIALLLETYSAAPH